MRPQDPIAIVHQRHDGNAVRRRLRLGGDEALTELFSTRLPAPPKPGEPNLWPGMSLTHVGFMVRVHVQLAFASTMVLHDRFDARWCLEQLQRLRPARLGGFPPVLVMLMRAPEFDERDWSFIKAVQFGGAPLAHISSTRSAPSSASTCSPATRARRPRSSAPPSPRSAGARAGTRRPADREWTSALSVTIAGRCRANEPGRIAVRSPATMRGYWRRPRRPPAR